MKFIIALFVVFSSLTLNATSLGVCKENLNSVEQITVSSDLDKKKARKNKRAKKRSRKSCSKWSKRIYAG